MWRRKLILWLTTCIYWQCVLSTSTTGRMIFPSKTTVHYIVKLNIGSNNLGHPEIEHQLDVKCYRLREPLVVYTLRASARGASEGSTDLVILRFIGGRSEGWGAGG